MKRGERVEMRRALDREMRPFREAAKEQNPTRPLLRAVRQALGVPVAEIAEELEVRPSVVFELEESERKGTISMRSLRQMAEAMGCKVVYGIVPVGGKTLREAGEDRDG
jgi:predicted DNA-binding mobile mystery protein A